MKNFLCIGDIMMDVSVVIDSEIHHGGDTQAYITTQGGGAAANVARWLAHLGQDVFLCSRIADDPNGIILQAELDKYCVRHANHRVPNEKTGTVVVLVTEDGERTMFPDSGSNSGLSATDLPPLDNFNAAYLSGYALINSKSRTNVTQMIHLIRAKGIPIVFDPGTVGALRRIPDSLLQEWIAMVDILLLNEEEALHISQANDLEGALVALAAKVSIVVIKRGAKGAIAISQRALTLEVPAPELEVVDTTGAGDSFAAGFMASWFADGVLATAVENGITQATFCVTNVGARPPLGKGL
jgi:sugar/nucleoside kinase (ribokinase family)